MSRASLFDCRPGTGIRIAAISVGLIVLACWATIGASSAQAQSGRRLPNYNEPKPQPKPTAPEEAAPADSTEKKPVLQLLVTTYNSAITVTSYVVSTAMQGFDDKMHEAKTVSAIHDKDMNRKEASDKAKAEKEAYVVLLELDIDSMNPTPIGPADPSYYFVNYTIFSPETGKVKTSGRVYQRSGVPIGGGGPGGSSPAYRLYYAGREAAERVLATFNIVPMAPH